MNDARKQPKAKPIHKEMGLTPEQVEAALRAEGYDPAAVVSSMRRLGRTLSAQFAETIRAEQLEASSLNTKLPRYSEHVAAGSPEWAGLAEAPKQVSALHLLGNPNPSKTMWVDVSGWSMRDVGINDGDTVLVDTKATPKDGDIVVAHIEGEGQVIKRLRTNSRWIILESANPDFPPREIKDPSTLRIHGVVTHRLGKA